MPVANKLPRQTEASFMGQVAQMAMLFHWRCAHFRAARTANGWRTACQYDAAGFPDLVLVRGQRLICAELKRDREKPTPAQEAWLKALGLVVGIEVYTWRPEDWPDIKRLLEMEPCRE